MSFSSRNLQSGTFRKIHLSNRDFLFFGGTAYLGLNSHPDFIRIFKEGIDRYGLNNGTSRTNNVQLGIYDAAEKVLSDQFQSEAAILVSSGYLAAQLAVKNLFQKGRTYFAPGSHPALWPDLTKPYPNISFDDWVEKTISTIENHPQSNEEFLIIGNTINNVFPEIYDYSAFQNLSKHKNIHLLLDDSHGIGVLNNNQIQAKVGLEEHVGLQVTIVASLAKGMGLDGGTILSTKQTIDTLKQSGFFVGASPTAPGFMHALLMGQDLYQKQFEKLQTNIRYFQKHLGKDWLYVNDFPVFCKLNQSIQDQLFEKGFLISSFPYPDPSDPILDRIVISAAHEIEDLDELLQSLHEIKAL